MGNPFQQGTHSRSGPVPETCQSLGEYLFVFLGLIISVNIGINIVTLLRCHLGGSLNQIFHNFFQEDNMLRLTPIIPKKLLIHRPPTLKQTQRFAVYQNPPVCQNPFVCWKSPVHRNPTVCRNPAYCDLCTMDGVTLDLTPPGSCLQHSVFSPAPNQSLNARLPNGNEEASQYWYPGNCQHDWDSPRPQAHWKGLPMCPPSPGVNFQQYLGRPAKRVEAKSKMGLEAYVFPINLSSQNAKSQSCKESTESGMYGFSPQFFRPVAISPLCCNPMPSTRHVMYDCWEKKREVCEARKGVDSLPYACSSDS